MSPSLYFGSSLPNFPGSHLRRNRRSPSEEVVSRNAHPLRSSSLSQSSTTSFASVLMLIFLLFFPNRIPRALSPQEHPRHPIHSSIRYHAIHRDSFFWNCGTSAESRVPSEEWIDNTYFTGCRCRCGAGSGDMEYRGPKGQNWGSMIIMGTNTFEGSWITLCKMLSGLGLMGRGVRVIVVGVM